jgi:prepilin-type N-terminal cleavage/methylation domain-containing protein
MLLRTSNLVSSASRRAFTLVEMAVVVAIVVIVASLVVPFSQSMLSDTRQTAAGDMVRGRLADARAMALEEGRAYKVGVQTGTGRIQIAPEEAACWDSVDSGMAMQQQQPGSIILDQLPEEVLFGTSVDDFLGRTSPVESQGSWRDAGVFLPDGSARGDVDIYFGKVGVLPTRFRVRGLTGVVSSIDPKDNTLEMMTP